MVRLIRWLLSIFTTFGGTGVTGLNVYSMFVAVVGSIAILVLYHSFGGRRAL
jgi:uncharacterized membrane protein YeaQ/YmgE (transglycosylase-associated protein family)